MKLRTTAGVFFLAAIAAAGLWDLQCSSAQVAATPAPAPAPAPLQPPTAELSISTAELPMPGEAPVLSPALTLVADPHLNAVYGVADKIVHLKTKIGNRHATDALRQAAATLRDAKDDAAKTAAQGQLTELLNKAFEDDMQRREQELAQVEQRTKDLRALMGRRREKKSEIVELQIKVLLNEADGLGFFNESPTPGPVAVRYNPMGVKHFSGNDWNTAAPSDSVLSPPPATTLPGAVPPAR
jgi:hypothetical protein